MLPALAADAAVTPVLAVARAAALPSWPAAEGHRFDVMMAERPDDAVALLHEQAFNALVLDASLMTDVEALERIREAANGAALLVLTDEYASGLSTMLDALHGACVLPADAPPYVQAQVIALAVDRAELKTSLVQRIDELEQSRSRFRDIIVRNADAIVVVDAEGVIRFANAMAAELFQTPCDSLVGAPFGFPLTAGETTEIDLLHSDGGRVVEMRVVESEWEGSAACIATLRDTTERRRAEDSARRLIREQEANRAKSELLAMISHDLRTPLTAIIGYAELLSMGISDQLSETGLRHVDRIAKSAQHLIFLIEQLSAYGRLEAGGETISPKDLIAQGIVHEVSAVIEPLATERHLEFRIDVPEEPVPVRTDPDRLRQVLLNLSGNAVKYTERGSVSIELARDGDAVAFRVRDTGIGISADELTHVFEPFWQADRCQRGTNGGSGLGLSIVKRLVDLLGGEISVESVPGDGSTFTVVLPG